MMDDRERGFALGASEYLCKPISRERLSEVMHRLGITPHDKPLLLVEDNSLTREALSRMLEADGWEVRTAKDGFQAMEHLQLEYPGLVILDLMMPGMDGFQLLAEMQQREDLQEIPVLVLTAKDLSPEDRNRLAGPPVHQVLQKGACSRENLLGAVRTLAMRSVTQSGFGMEKEP